MTNSEQEREAAATPKSSEDLAMEFRLRAEPPRIVRLSRKVLAGGSAIVMLLVGGAVILGLRNNRQPARAPEELYSTDHHNVADGLETLPRDYASVPKQIPSLGPPLPGDLGPPILSAQGQPPPTSGGSLDREQQQREQEAEAARVSRLFASTNARETVPNAGATGSGTSSGMAANNDESFAQNGQDRKLAFVNAPVDRRTTSPDRITKPASPYVIQAGTIIPGALITGIRSDLPGQITAQVTESVYDTPSGRFLLIPQGARLIGIYDSQVTFGQSRVLFVWTRLMLPNGRSIVLDRQPGADAAGYSGVEDDVDNHWKELLGAAALSTLLAVGAEVNTGADANNNNAAIISALRRGTGQSLNQTGQQIVSRNLNVQPTLTVRPGFPIRAIVNRDLLLEPYRG
jgi:type IV secretion system protein VirB10